MEQTIPTIVLTIVFVAILFLYQYFQQKFIRGTMALLYQGNNPKEYLNQLNSFLGKIFISSKNRIYLSIDAYLVSKDYVKLEELFTILSAKRLSYGKRISLYQKQITYFVEVKKYDEAIVAYEKFIAEASKINDKKLIQTASELELIMNVYVYHHLGTIENLIELSKTLDKGMQLGIYYYRIAVGYYYNNQLDECKVYLKLAEKNFRDSPLEKVVKKLLKDDLKRIEDLIM